MADKPLDWNQSDAVALRTYVAGNPKFISELMRRLPKIEGNTMEARAVTGSDVKGFLDAIDALHAMQQDEVTGDKTEFIDERAERKRP